MPDAAARGTIVVIALILLGSLGLTGAISKLTAGASCMSPRRFCVASCCIAISGIPMDRWSRTSLPHCSGFLVSILASLPVRPHAGDGMRTPFIRYRQNARGARGRPHDGRGVYFKDSIARLFTTAISLTTFSRMRMRLPSVCYSPCYALSSRSGMPWAAPDAT